MRTARVVAAAFLVGGLLPLGAIAPDVCAAEGPHAALVVDTEAAGGQYRYCVALPDESVTGLELIELASEQHGLQYRLGYGGNVVCRLAGVGYDSDECLKDGPEFWGYWRGDGSGGWEWSSSGGNATVVKDGDVEGWSWGTGNDGSSHPAPPETTFASLCGAPAGPDRDDDEKSGSKSPKGPNGGDKGTSADASGSVPTNEAQGAAARGEKEVRPGRGGKVTRKKRDRPPDGARARKPVGQAPSPAPSVGAPAPETDPASSSEEGPPVGGVVAASAAVACLVGGSVLQRRRNRTK